MSALTAEQRERLRLFAGSLFKDGERAGLQFPITYADLRALLADADALAAAERERDEAQQRLDSQTDYSIHLQRLIEACAHGYPLRDDSIAGAPFHGEKARMIAANIDALRAQVATLREALEGAASAWDEGTGPEALSGMGEGAAWAHVTDVGDEIAEMLRAVLASTAPEREGADGNAR